MRNLLAILFHRVAAPEKTESAHARKQADSFAKVLQSSLRDSNRESGSGLASNSPASALPETEGGPTQVSDAAQDGQADNLAAQRIASPRGDRDENRIGPKTAAHDDTVPSPSSQTGDKAHGPQQTRRGYAPSPSQQAPHGDPASARSEMTRAQSSSPKPDAAPASQRPGGSSAPHARAATSLLPEPSVEPGTVDRVQPHPQATTTTPRAAADAAVNAPSGETNMPPNTSVRANPLASSDVPSARSGEKVRPQAWRIASADAPERPIQPARMQATDCAAPAQTLDHVSAGPADLDAAASQSGSHAAQVRSPLPVAEHPLAAELPDEGDELVDSETAPTNLDATASKSRSQAPQIRSPLPVAEHPLAAKLPTEGDELVDSETAPALASASSASPEATAPSGEPIVGPSPSPAMPATNAAGGQVMLPVPADPTVASARRELTRPSPERSVPAEVRAAGLPSFASRRHAEASPTRGEQQGTTVSPVAGEPKKVETSAKPSGFVGSSDGRTALRPHNGTQTPSVPPTDSKISVGEPQPVPPGPVSRAWPKQRSAATEVGRAAETTSPAATGFVGPEKAKPNSKEITFITQAAIEIPQPSDSAIPSAPTAPNRPTHPRTSARPLETQPAAGTRRPTHEGTGHPLPTTPPLHESPKPSTPVTSSTLTAEEAGPGASPRPGTKAVDLELPEMPAAPSPSPAVVAGQDEPERPVVTVPRPEKPTVTLSAQPVPRSHVSEPKAQAPESSELVEPVQTAHTSMPEPVPSAHTRRTEKRPAVPSHDTLPSAQSDPAQALPAQPQLDPISPAPAPHAGQAPITASPRGQADPITPAPAPHAGQAPIAASPRGRAIPEHPVVPPLNHGPQIVPPAHQPKAEPAVPSAESETSTKLAPSLPAARNVPSSGTAPSTASSPPAVHAPRLAGRQNPRTPHPGSHAPQPEEVAKPLEAKLPSSAPQVETQPASPAETEDAGGEGAVASAAPIPTSPPSNASQPLSSPAQPVVPPLAATAPTPSEKPMPRTDASAPAAPVAPVTASQTAPGVSQSPALAVPLQAESARMQRGPRSAEEDARFPQAETSPTPATPPHQARPLTAPAPHANASDKQNSAGDQNPNRQTPTQATPVLPAGNDRPIDWPAPQTPASPSPSDASAIAPAQPSAPVGQAPPVEVRSPHLPHPMVPLATQAARDDGLTMTVMPHVAHMSIESRDGDLALHLRVRDGSADVTVGGSMAPLFEARAPEARAALASEGLNLGRFDLGQQSGGGGGQQGQPAPERHERAAEPATPYRQQSSHHEPTPGDGRIHVTA